MREEYSIKICQTCGNTYKPTSSKQKWCVVCGPPSLAAGYKSKLCLACGQEFKPTSSKQRYCSTCGPTMRREYVKNYDKEYRARATYPARCRAFPSRISGRDKRLIYFKEYDAIHREEKSEYHKIYRRTPKGKEVGRRGHQKHRNGLRAGGILDIGGFYTKCVDLDWHCQICGKVLTKETVTIDHIVPVSKGGTNAIDNLQPLCSKCNSTKGNRPMSNYIVNTSSQCAIPNPVNCGIL